MRIFCVFVLSCVCFVFVRVCLFVLCGHLLGKGWPLPSRLWCLIVSLSLSHWYPGSGVVLDCIDSWSLHPYLLIWILGTFGASDSWTMCKLFFLAIISWSVEAFFPVRILRRSVELCVWNGFIIFSQITVFIFSTIHIILTNSWKI